MKKSFLFIWIFIHSVKCGYYFVTLPNVIRYDHDETVVVNVFEQDNAAIKIWLQHGEKEFSAKNVVVPNEENPVTTTIKVTENDLFDKVIEEKPRSILVCSEFGGQRQCREVILSYQTGYLIVQTDKPVYTPLNAVTVRTLALDEHLRAVDGWEVGIDIISPSNVIVARRKFSKSLSGFYQEEFRLPPNPETGIWTAKAFYSGMFETEATALFDVQEYVLPTFDVLVNLDVPVILPETSTIKATVNARYGYRLAVKGIARLTLFLKDVSGVSEYLLDVNKAKLENGVIEFIIKVGDILNAPYLRDRDFPEKCHLEVVATVFESDTGKEVYRSDDNTVFALQPYVFKFTKSKRIFRPGLTYYSKVDMLHANGQPVSGEKIRLKMYKNGRLYRIDDATTDSKGTAIVAFPTSFYDNTVAFTAASSDERQESETFDVKGFIDDNQITAENFLINETLTLRASNNMDFSGSTGMLFLLVSRGKVVYTKFKKASNQASEIVTEDIKEMIAPRARLLVFYVNKGTNAIFADSVKIEVDQKCPDRGLKLDAGQQQIKPGSMAQLSIEGDPFMWVGLNIMDKSLLSNKHVLLETKIFKAFASHDLGCGEGSGINSADVFKKTGLTVLSNAALSVNDLQRNSVDCDETKRKKRNSRATECYYDADMACCNRGYEFAKEVMKEPVYQERLDSSTKCYAKARTLEKDIQSRCLMAVFKSCKTRLEFFFSRRRNPPPNELDEESDYIYDKRRLIDDGYRPLTRKYFQDSWLTEVFQLDKSGMAITQLKFPDSLTEWMIQAIGITADKGLCIADPFNVTAFRSFFIQLDLPYKTTRFEHFDVKATIFNYGHSMEQPRTVNIYLEGVENLCYSSESGKPSHKIQIELPPNSARTVSFPMIPLKKGKFPIKVTAIVIDSQIPEVDVIEKPLYVVNEGIEEQLTIQVCLDPNKQMEDCKNDPRVFKDVDIVKGERVYSVDLTLPKDSIPGTRSAAAYTESDKMANVVKTLIEGVDSLFQQPAGCGEQTMIRLAPTVYAMMYAKETRQVTEDIEVKGNQWIRDAATLLPTQRDVFVSSVYIFNEGVTREVSQFMHSDGSYAAWQHRQSSTWLTAFVSKVLCQAERVVDGAVDEQASIDWLKNHVTDDGQFIDHMPVIHREMIGQIKEKDPSLTAFVLITLLECDIRTEGLDQTIRKSTKFLENLDKNLLEKNPYILALSTYALAMAKSAKRWEFKALLHKIENKTGKDTYWRNAGGNPASAHSVETTAYALLAMLECNDWTTSANIVRWLTSQIDVKGYFRKTQDTVIGLQSLSAYRRRTYLPNVDLKIHLLVNQWEDFLSITRENAPVQQIVSYLPVEHNDNVLAVKVSGSGKGIMNIDLRYNRPAREGEGCPFEISYIETDLVNDFPIDPFLSRERKCDVCGHCEEEQDDDDYNFDVFDPPEADPKMESKFGISKRKAGRHVRPTKTTTCVRFSVRSKTEKKFGMSIVNFGLETDVSVVKEDLDKLLADNQNIARYEMPISGKGFVVFYLQEVTSDETKFIFLLKDRFEGDFNSRQPSFVKVYDYYNPDMSCTRLYGAGPNQGVGVGYECDKEQKHCYCLQSNCVQPVKDKLKILARSKRYPALKLYRYTCNPETADYAVVVEIESVGYDPRTKQKTATARVLKSIIKGIKQLSKDDNMAFFWSLGCDEPNLEEGGIYYIIGKDGNLFLTDEGTKYKYPLMGTALVIRKTGMNRFISLLLQNYEKIINAHQGCVS